MPRQTFYYSCGFTAGRGSSLKADNARPAKTSAEAVRSAERLAGIRLGAVAYSVEGDTDTDDYELPVVLFQVGRLPADFGQ